jgi:acetolactate synthase-1/3 small subunit
MSRAFVVRVQEGPDVLTRLVSLCRRKAFAVESITMGRTETPGVSRVSLFVDTDEAGGARLVANLAKLVDVVEVEDVTERPVVVRDLAMIKVAASPESRADIMQIVHVFRARVVDVGADSLVIETTGSDDKVDGLLQVLRPFGVREVARTGRLAMCRGSLFGGPKESQGGAAGAP